MAVSSITEVYSVFNVLDEIAKNPTAIKLNTPPPTRTQHDNSIKQLQTTLHTLAGTQNSHQLPLVPDDYANFEDDAQFLQLRARMKSREPRGLRLKAHKHIIAPASTPKRYVHDSALDEAVGTESSTSIVLSRTEWTRRSLATQSYSRPTSMYSTSTARRISIVTRPNTSETMAAEAEPRLRRRSITYEAQRFSPPALPCTSLDPGSHSAPQRRPFRAIASLKNLRAHGRAEKRRKTSDDVNIITTTGKQQNHDGALSLTESGLTLEEALRAPTMALDPVISIDRACNFHEQPWHMLAPKESAPTTSSEHHGGEMLRSLSDQPVMRVRKPTHAHKASEAMSISSSILDYAWPEPDTHHDPVVDKECDRPRPDSSLEGMLETTEPPTLLSTLKHTTPVHGTRYSGAFCNVWVGSNGYMTSPPPTCPLPACPLPIRVTNTLPSPPASSSSNARLKSIADKKGLVVAAASATRLSVCLKDRNDRPAEMRLSPLKLRSNTSYRNTKVESLKRKHLSLLVKDSEHTRGGDEYFTEAGKFLRRGSAPSIVQTVGSLETLVPIPMPARKQCPNVDKPLPLPPTTRPKDGVSVSGSFSSRRRKTQHTQKTDEHLKNEDLSVGMAVEVADDLSLASLGIRSASDASKGVQVIMGTDTDIEDDHINPPSLFSKAHSRADSAGSQPSTSTSFSSPVQHYDTDITSPPSSVTSSFGAPHTSSLAYYEARHKTDQPLRISPALLPPFDERKQQALSRSDNMIYSKTSIFTHSTTADSSEREFPSCTSIKAESPRLPGLRGTNMPIVDVKDLSDAEYLNHELEKMGQVYRNMISRVGAIPGNVSDAKLASCKTQAQAVKSLARQQSEGQIRSRKTSQVLSRIQDDFTTGPPTPADEKRTAGSCTISRTNSTKQPPRVPLTEMSPMSDILNICARPAFRNRLDSQRCELLPRKPCTRPNTATIAHTSNTSNTAKFSLFPQDIHPKTKVPSKTAPTLKAREVGSAPSPAISATFPRIANKKRYSTHFIIQ